MTCLLTTHEVTWDYQDSFCANQYAFPDQPEEFPSMPVKTVIRRSRALSDLSFEKFTSPGRMTRMTDSLFEVVASATRELTKYGFSTQEFATLVQQHNMTDVEVLAVAKVFD